MVKASIKDLFFTFLKIGLLGFGGGPVVIPLIHKEVVEKHQWMSDDDFSDIIAITNTLPGPVQTKIAGYIGYRLSGIGGLLSALAAIIVPTGFLATLFILSLTEFKEIAWVQGMKLAILPVVGVMMVRLTWQFLLHSKKAIGWKFSSLIILISLLVIEVIHLHPVFVIVPILLLALLLPERKAVHDDLS